MSVSTSSRQTRGVLIALLGTAFWSTTAIFIRYLTEQAMPPLVLAFWREVFVSVLLFIILLVARPALLRITTRQLGFMVMYGFVLMLFNGLWTISVAINGAAVATVLAYSSPAFTALLGWWLLREKMTITKIMAVFLSMAGCVLVAQAYLPEVWNTNLPGVTVGLMTGILFAVFSIFGKEASNRGIHTLTSMAYSFAFAALYFMLLFMLPLSRWFPLLAAVGGWSDILWLGSDLTGWLVLLVLAWIPTVGGFGFYTLSLNYLPASTANLVTSLEPSMTALLAFGFLGETMSLIQLAGMLLVAGGVILLQARTRSSAEVLSPGSSGAGE